MYVSIMERKGIEKGIQLGKLETARNLLRMGLDLARIAEATGLTLEEVKALKNMERAQFDRCSGTPAPQP